jgi:hypothetical protein
VEGLAGRQGVEAGSRAGAAWGGGGGRRNLGVGAGKMKQDLVALKQGQGILKLGFVWFDSALRNFRQKLACQREKQALP